MREVNYDTSEFLLVKYLLNNHIKICTIAALGSCIED